MKVKTSELEGQALNWAVEHCEGWGHAPQAPDYSTEWPNSGPIIERERVGIEPWGPGITWLAQSYNSAGRISFREYGSSPLIAAMRCYVASKLGEEVDIPDELA